MTLAMVGWLLCTVEDLKKQLGLWELYVSEVEYEVLDEEVMVQRKVTKITAAILNLSKRFTRSLLQCVGFDLWEH